MSDGPHKSLPLKRHWKELAKRAATAAYSPSEVLEALVPAVQRDFGDTPLEQIKEILAGSMQLSFFVEERIAQLEAVRSAHRGCVAADTLIDCAINAVELNLTGDTAYKTALKNAMHDHVLGYCHSIEEHYIREDESNAVNVRERLRAACASCSFEDITDKLMVNSRPSRSELLLPKRDGADDGPPL